MLVTSNPIRFDPTSTSSVTNPLTFTPIDRNWLVMALTTVVLPEPGIPTKKITDDIRMEQTTWSIGHKCDCKQHNLALDCCGYSKPVTRVHLAIEQSPTGDLTSGFVIHVSMALFSSARDLGAKVLTKAAVEELA